MPAQRQIHEKSSDIMRFRSISVDWIAGRVVIIYRRKRDARDHGHRMRPVTIIRMAISRVRARTRNTMVARPGVGNLAGRREIDSGVLAARC